MQISCKVPLFSHALFFAFLLMLLDSCTSLRSISIQIAQKEPFPLPETIQSLTVMNYAMHPGSTNQHSDSLERIFLQNKTFNSVIYDSLAADTAIRTVAKTLFESGRYDIVVPLYHNILRTDTLFDGDHLSPLFVIRTCRDYRTDAVLVLADFAERIVVQRTSSIELYYSAVWMLYHPNDSSGIKRYAISGSKPWLGRYEYLPYLKDVLVEGGILSADKLAGYISPAWKDYYREYYFTAKRRIDAAIPLIKANKWEEAAVIWSGFVTSESIPLRSKVEFNMALASEMKGDLKMAVHWCRKSFSTKNTEAAKSYLSALEARQKESESGPGKKPL